MTALYITAGIIGYLVVGVMVAAGDLRWFTEPCARKCRATDAIGTGFLWPLLPLLGCVFLISRLGQMAIVPFVLWLATPRPRKKLPNPGTQYDGPEGYR